MVNTKNACRKVNALLVRYLVHQTQDQTNNNADKNPWIFYFPRKFFVTSKMAQYLNEALMSFGRFQANTKNECLELSWNVDSSNFPLLKKILEHWKSFEVRCFLMVAVICFLRKRNEKLSYLRDFEWTLSSAPIHVLRASFWLLSFKRNVNTHRTRKYWVCFLPVIWCLPSSRKN